MQKVCITTNVYVITVDDLYKGTKFHVRATQAGAQNLFKKIIMENYFDSEEDTEKDLEQACYEWYWESQHGHIVTCAKCTAVADGENLTVIK